MVLVTVALVLGLFLVCLLLLFLFFDCLVLFWSLTSSLSSFSSPTLYSIPLLFFLHLPSLLSFALSSFLTLNTF